MVYAVIALVELSEQEVTITATGTTSHRGRRRSPEAFSQRGTPPDLLRHSARRPHHPARQPCPTPAKSTLGENITSFTLTAAEGVDSSGVQSRFALRVRRPAVISTSCSTNFLEVRIGVRCRRSYESENAQRRFVRHPGTDGRRHYHHRNPERTLSDGGGFLELTEDFSGNVNLERPSPVRDFPMDSRQPLARMEKRPVLLSP